MNATTDPNIADLQELIHKYSGYRDWTRQWSVSLGIMQIVFATLVPVILLVPDPSEASIGWLSHKLLASLFGAAACIAKGVDEVTVSRRS